MGLRVFAAVNAWSLPQDWSPGEQVGAAARAGLRGIELVLGERGPLDFETALDEFRVLGEQAESLGLTITSLATDVFWRVNYGVPERADRARAMELTLRMLDRAAAARAGAILVVPAVVGRADEARRRVGYADALSRAYEALLSLRFEAEDRGVVIAIENVWNRFLLSAMEMVELIDRVNSPCVGAYLDIGNVLAYGYPEDWIELLGRRIARVHAKDYDVRQPGAAGFCPLGEGSIDWPGVIAALRQVGYTGPLTYEGPGELVDIAARLNRILRDAGVDSEEKS
jgi:L-ribulose-5-phosphate 3-epimerase